MPDPVNSTSDGPHDNQTASVITHLGEARNTGLAGRLNAATTLATTIIAIDRTRQVDVAALALLMTVYTGITGVDDDA
ncbi:MAG: hypothetical protein ABI137_13575 [Antricoccus sp.]